MSVVWAPAFLLLGAATLLRQDPQKALPVFGASVENVYIDAFVSEHGAPVTGLLASDFELKDNGVVQRLELVASDTQPLLAVLTFDVSNSLDGEKRVALTAASQALLETLRPEDEATLLTFADQVDWLVRPTTDKTSIQRALDKLKPGGGTPVIDALYAAMTLPISRGRTLVVLFTDGVDNLSWLDWRQVQAVAERSNALVHVVTLQPPRVLIGGVQGPLTFGGHMLPAVGARTIEFEGGWALRNIAESTGGRFWEAESLERLKTAFATIAEAMGKRYVLRYSPDGVPRPGWHKLALKLRKKKGDVHTRTGYWVKEP